MPTLAFFVSPHGFGHAARSCAVIERLLVRDADLRVEIFTTVPQWFFTDTLGDRFRYHELVCDLGLVQRTALEEDIPATVAALDAMLPFDERRLSEVAERLHCLGCSAVVNDISPLGIAVARRAGLPSILVENFTWGWIYRHHERGTPELRRHGDRLDEFVARVDLHLQSEPACQTTPGACPVGPIARRLREPAESVRARLGIHPHEQMVLVSMGGVRWSYGELEALQRSDRIVAVIPGAGDVVARQGSLVRLPHRGPFHHPDLVNASDLIIGKLGYSTVAEAAHYGRRFLVVSRPAFPESAVLEAYVRRRLRVAVLEPSAFDRGDWMPSVLALLEVPVGTRERVEDGAADAADLILRHVVSGDD